MLIIIIFINAWLNTLILFCTLDFVFSCSYYGNAHGPTHIKWYFSNSNKA